MLSKNSWSAKTLLLRRMIRKFISHLSGFGDETVFMAWKVFAVALDLALTRELYQ